jgi:hypothetical protein
MTRLRRQNLLGAAKARVPIHFRENLSKIHFRENLSRGRRPVMPRLARFSQAAASNRLI